MRPARNKIFRESALRLYMANSQKVVMPMLARPNSLKYFWAVVMLLAVALILAGSATVPVHVSGEGLLIERPGLSSSCVSVLALLPPDSLHHLAPGQKMLARLNTAGRSLEARIIAVEPEVLSPEVIRRRFNLSAAMAGVVREPSAVAIAELDPLPGGSSPSIYLGTMTAVEVSVGTQRLIQLLPLTSGLFER